MFDDKIRLLKQLASATNNPKFMTQIKMLQFAEYAIYIIGIALIATIVYLIMRKVEKKNDRHPRR